MESDNMKREDDIEEPKPLKKYQFELMCRFELQAESKPDAIITAVEM